MKKLLMLAMVLVMFAIVGCGGGGSSKNMFTEQGELVRIMDELKNKDGFKGVGNERCFGRFAGNIAVIVNFGVAAQAHGFSQIRTVFGEVEMVNNRHFVLG